MLEGMAPAQSRAVRDEAGSLLLYSPVVEKRDRDASIAYLSRRLDENSGPENFLRALFDLTPDSPAWQREIERFRASLARTDQIETTSHRDQDRRTESLTFTADGLFANVADTDFTTPGNRAWAAEILARPAPSPTPLVTTIDEVDAIVARARTAQAAWMNTSWQERRDVLARVATELAARRADLLSVMATTTGKTLREGDPEISEGIDFVTYASHLTLEHEQRATAAVVDASSGDPRRRSVELPVRDPDRWPGARTRRRWRGNPQAGPRGPRGRCPDRRRLRGSRGTRGARPTRLHPRRRGRPAPGHPRRSRPGDLDRQPGNGADVPRVASRSGAARGNLGKERAHHHRSRRSRPGDQGSGALRLRACRPEVFGSEPGDRRGQRV